MNKNKKKYLIAVSAFVVCFLMFVLAIRVQKMYANKVTNEQTTSQKTQSNTVKDEAKENKDVKKENENKKTEDSAAKVPAAAGESVAAKPEKDKSKDGSNTQASSTANTASTSNVANTTNENNTQPNPAVQVASVENIKVKPDDPEENYSFQFIDTVNGNNVFLKKNVDDMDGETVGYITEKLLDEAKINFKATGSASTLYFAAINGLEEKKAGKLSGWCYYVRKKGENKFQKPNIGSGQWIYHKGDIIVWKYLADGIHDGYSDDWMK